jgi:hypothetical protein
MKFNTLPSANPVFFFGLENAIAPADWLQATTVGMFADFGLGNQLGLYAHTTAGASNEFGVLSITPPSADTYFTMALVVTSGMDASGPNPTETRFQTYYNGVLMNTGATKGTSIACQSFALGLLKSSGGAPCTFDEARVYNKALTALEVSQLESGAVSTPSFTRIFQSGANVVLQGTGGTASGSFQVLATTDITVARASWSPVSTNSFDASGNFSVTNALQAGARFYIIKQ